jgi:carboxylate-amine ligase
MRGDLGKFLAMTQLTLGVEEEYQLVDAGTGALRPVNDVVLDTAAPAMGESVHPELMRSQIEVSTTVCTSLDQVARELRELRQKLNAVAAGYGCRLGAAGTHPTAQWQNQEVTPSERYLEMAGDYQQVALETLIFGCHVHVGIDDPETRIRVMNHIRRWLPTLLALSANSPFWAGRDTGYASYRTMVFRRWPTTGMPESFSGNDEYEGVVATLVQAGALEDATHLYWDVRPSARFATLEVRIADVCLTVAEAVTMAGLVAAMAATAARELMSGRPRDDARHELLEAAVWRAARYGLTDQLIDVNAAVPRPANDVVAALLTTLRDALEESGSWDRVGAGVEEIVGRGNGAARQRAVLGRTGHFGDVINYIADQTASGT